MAMKRQSQSQSQSQSHSQDEEIGLTILNRHIPSCIISDMIISTLRLEDIIRCSSVSTDFHKLAKNLRSNPFHMNKSEILNILISEGEGNVNSDYVNINNTLHMISSHSMKTDGTTKHLEIKYQNHLKGRVIGTCNGLLCIAHSWGSPYAIYNPITKEKMILPILKLHPKCDKPFAIRSGFGYDPISKKYKVVVAYDSCHYIDGNRSMLVATGDIITVGESSWRRLEFPEEVTGRIDTYQPVVFINGCFHWLNDMQHDYEFSNKETYQLDGILTLDITTEMFKFTKFSTFLDLDVSRVQVFDMGSSLALVGEKLIDNSVEDDILDDDDSKPQISTWKIWKILGEYAQGGFLYQCITLNVDLMTMRFLKPVGALGNDRFLFKASKYRPKNMLSRLILYDIENDKGSFLEVPAEVPRFHDATIFQPSLVSPASLGRYSH